MALGNRNSRGLWIAAAISLLLSLTPWGPILLYPFKLFTTWIHECGHAVMALLVGGSVRSITIARDTSGFTESVIPATRLARILVASSGYLGASLVGCGLITATRLEKWTHAILWSVGAFMVVTSILWIRNGFGFVIVLAWGAALVVLGRLRHNAASGFVLGLLAIQVALNAVYDIRILFGLTRGPSDAQAMARLLWLPSWVWAAVWMLASIAMLTGTLWITRGRSQWRPFARVF